MTVRELMDVSASTLNIMGSGMYKPGEPVFSIYPMFTEYGVLSEKFLNAEVKIVESRDANITNVYIELEDFNDVKDWTKTTKDIEDFQKKNC